MFWGKSVCLHPIGPSGVPPIFPPSFPFFFLPCPLVESVRHPFLERLPWWPSQMTVDPGSLPCIFGATSTGPIPSRICGCPQWCPPLNVHLKVAQASPARCGLGVLFSPRVLVFSLICWGHLLQPIDGNYRVINLFSPW